MVNRQVRDQEYYLRQVGPGWHALVNRCWSAVDESNASDPHGPVAEITQVKEKFAQLRIYCCYGDDNVHKVIAGAERESVHTCEYCGDQKTATTRRTASGWIKTFCDAHAENGPELLRGYREHRMV